MLPEIESLLVVQDRDQKIHDVKQQLAKIPRDKAKLEARLKEEKLAAMAAKKAVQENEVAMKNIELDVATRKNSIEKMQVQQFETTKNTEFEALGEDIKRYTEQVDELETQELELMENHDTLIDTHTAAVETFKASQTEIESEFKDFETKTTELEARLAELQPERETLTQKVDAGILSLYERLLKSKGTDPVVQLKGTQCNGCHMKVIKTTIAGVLAENNVTQCENCGRFLYSI